MKKVAIIYRKTYDLKNGVYVIIKRELASDEEDFINQINNECPKCAKIFETEAKLKEHVRRTHLEEPLQCEQCDKIYGSIISYHELGQTFLGLTFFIPKCLLFYTNIFAFLHHHFCFFTPTFLFFTPILHKYIQNGKKFSKKNFGVKKLV